MGTYTTNYNLFMPTIGEQGWGDLVNGNFTTIDTTMKGLDTRLTTCESTDVAYNTRLETLEAGEFENINCYGTITADSVTADTITGTINVTDTITIPLNPNGVIVIVNKTISVTTTNNKTVTSEVFTFPNNGSLRYSGNYTATFTGTFPYGDGYSYFELFINDVSVGKWTGTGDVSTRTLGTYNLSVNDSIYFVVADITAGNAIGPGTLNILAKI